MGVDFGQAQDYSACVVLDEKTIPGARPVYTVVVAHRWDLGTPYPQIIGSLQAHLSRPEMQGHRLVVDYTGAGRPIVDELRCYGLQCTAVGIHGGMSESHEGWNWNVPKRDLVTGMVLPFQWGRLHFADGIPLLATLQDEMQLFHAKINDVTAHESYSFWYEIYHKDLVISLALACWLAERFSGYWVPTVNLRLALDNNRTPRQSPGPTEAARPRSTRIFPGVTDDEPHGLDWDAAKRGVADGTTKPPSRSPWVD